MKGCEILGLFPGAVKLVQRSADEIRSSFGLLPPLLATIPKPGSLMMLKNVKRPDPHAYYKHSQPVVNISKCR